MPDICATLMFSTVGMPEPERTRAVRDLHVHERPLLSAKLSRVAKRRSGRRLEPRVGRLKFGTDSHRDLARFCLICRERLEAGRDLPVDLKWIG